MSAASRLRSVLRVSRRLRGALLAAAAALALIAAWPSRPDVGTPVVAARGDLVLSVEVEGELAAVHSTEIGVPAVSETEFRIAFLAPEGAVVHQGDSILRFDTEALERQLAQKRAELQEAAQKVEQKRLELRMKRLDLEQRTAQAQADLAKARLKADLLESLESLVTRLERDKARIDRSGREREIENLEAERRLGEATGGAELRSLVQQRDRAQGRVRALEEAIGKMNVRAPQDGILVYATDWNEEKKKVGDSAWFGEKLLELPDLASMRGDGFVDEADAGPVAPGQPVTIRLEARPDQDLHGKVARIAHAVKRRSWRTPLKGFRVEIALARTDPLLMRPAMRFRGEIETGRVRDVLLLPRTSVFLRPRGPVAWVEGRLGWRERPLRLGRSSRTQVEVLSGLRAGESVSARDLALGAGGAAPAGGPS